MDFLVTQFYSVYHGLTGFPKLVLRPTKFDAHFGGVDSACYVQWDGESNVASVGWQVKLFDPI